MSQAVRHADSVENALRLCTVQHFQFSDAWGCIQARFVAGQIKEADPRLKPFLKLGDDLAQQTEDKNLSENEARKQLIAGHPGEAVKPQAIKLRESAP